MKIQAMHGTSLEFNRFSFDFAGSGSGYGAGTDEGIFLAEDREHAEYWAHHSASATGGVARVLSVEADVANILEFDVAEFVQSSHPMAGNPIEYAIELARGEYDAIRFLNAYDIPDADAFDYWFVFDPDRLAIVGCEVLA